MSSLQRDCVGEGSNLHRHMCDLIGKCTTTENALEKFEELSIELKYQRFRPPEGPDKKKKISKNPILEMEQKKSRERIVGLVKDEAKGRGGEDFMEQAAIMKMVGLGFSEQESYLLSLKTNEISKREGVESVRFWGKILGKDSDYYIYEATLSGEGLASEEIETRGAGANQYTYFVQSGPLEPLLQLPEVSPEEIQASRLISRMFSGNLNRDVVACPWFSGKEIHLLRAQIARISAASTLHYAGFYGIDEETGKLVKAEEPPVPTAEDMVNQGTWVHIVPYILPNGRTAYPSAEVMETMEEEAKALLEEEMAAAPVVPLLTSIQEDLEKDEEGNSLGWRIRQYGDKSTYQFGDITRQFTNTVVQSLRWPGAYTVAQGAKCYNFYVGYGLKGDFKPVLLPYIDATQLAPDTVMMEPVDFAELPEPNPIKDDEAASDGGDEDQPVEGEA